MDARKFHLAKFGHQDRVVPVVPVTKAINRQNGKRQGGLWTTGTVREFGLRDAFCPRPESAPRARRDMVALTPSQSFPAFLFRLVKRVHRSRGRNYVWTDFCVCLLCFAGTPQQATRHLLQFLSKQEVERLKGFDHENGFRWR